MAKLIKSDKLTDKQKHKIKFQEALKKISFFLLLLSKAYK